MADFWGLKESYPEKWNNEGVSIAIVSTQKGQKAVDFIKNRCEMFSASIEDTNQPHLSAPACKPDGYDAFWNYYNKCGFKNMIVKYFHGGAIRRLLSDLINKFKQNKREE